MATKSRILVVDDDYNISELIRLYLEKEGFEIRNVYDGNKALSEFSDFAPSLVILDIMLPGRDGWEICREIQLSNIPIIML